VEKVAAKRGNSAVAKAYLDFLYTPEAQAIAARQGYRPRDAKALAKSKASFASLKQASIEDFGGWSKAQKDFFGDGGIFDQIYNP
jgi:sulfate transport system substrate-binding protein